MTADINMKNAGANKANSTAVVPRQSRNILVILIGSATLIASIVRSYSGEGGTAKASCTCSGQTQ